MKEIFELVFTSFWTFLGTVILLVIGLTALVLPMQYAFNFWNRMLRTINIRKHGWPVAPIDADGDVCYRWRKDDDDDD